MNRKAISSYEDWLSLSSDERTAVRDAWNAYEHEMFWVPMTAAARLASQTKFPVNDLYAGIYHGGEYVLHLTVAQEFVASLPRPLEQEFEGFRVIWIDGGDDPVSKTPGLLGHGKTSGDGGVFDVIVSEHDGDLIVKCVDLAVGKELKVYCVQKNEDGAIEFVTRQESKVLSHRLSEPSGNALNYQVCIGQFAKRSAEG